MRNSLWPEWTCHHRRVVTENQNTPHPVLRLAANHPYPTHYRTEGITKDGSRILVRPIHPEDEPLLLELFQRLSEETIYFRFLTNLRTLPPETLHLFANINYAQDVAMVAFRENESSRSILGVCRIMREAGSKRGEIAVVVEDAWQGKGIGSILIRHAVNIAKELGVEEVWGSASIRNKRLFVIAEKLGFSIKPSPERGLFQVELCISPES
jgi:acetyltransferase